MTVSTNSLTQWPASWSPDGRKIASAASDASSGSSMTSLFLMGPGIGAPIQTVVADAAGATSARFSPDGAWIAFDRAQQVLGSPHDLFVIHPDGTAETNLSSGFEPHVCCGLWSPDGTALLVAGTRLDDSATELFIISLTGEVRQVTQNPNHYGAFQWGVSAP